MKTIDFQDSNGNTLRVQHSSAIMPSYRIYVSYSKDANPLAEKTEEVCIHLNEMQAQILINSLQDLMNDNA